MASAVLDKLKIKPTPQVNESIQISIKKPQTQLKEGVEIKKISIIDKSSSSNFDRASFLQNILKNKDLTETPSSLTESPSIKPDSATKGKKKDKKSVTEKVITPAPATPAPATPAPAAPAPAAPAPAAPAPALVEVKKTSFGDEDIVKSTASIKGKETQKEKPIMISTSSYYLNNREIFINFISSLFEKYKKELLLEAEKEVSCKQRSEDFSLMTHQKIVRDYLSLYTPYRGLLLYHGLGSGKTCSSIAIAEGLKTNKQIMIMTPASLKTNYLEELKKCGDVLYKKTQYWDFIKTNNNEDLTESLSKMLALPLDYITKAGGAWMIDVKKNSNYDNLSTDEKLSLDKQINEMIRYKYKFISYNGLRNTHLQVLTNNFNTNPFDNTVVIIDESHNFVSRIVNKIKKLKTVKNKKDLPLSLKLYEYLMNAENARIILLSGTPVINYPNELGIMFNILRGKIKTWNLKLNISELTGTKVSKAFFQKILNKENNLMDYIEYNPSLTTLIITRNPYGFINKPTEEIEIDVDADADASSSIYKGVIIGEQGVLDDTQFIKLVSNILATKGIKIAPYGKKLNEYKALPDTIEEFEAFFIDSTKNVQNMNMFKRRILGLTSYFHSAQEGLMPNYEKKSDFIIVRIPMSLFQFNVYEEARVEERNQEKAKKKSKGKKKKEDEIYDEVSSTYRIFSRLFCNFVFPHPAIKRPMPSGEGSTIKNELSNKTDDEDIIDLVSDEEKLANTDGKYEADDIFQDEEDNKAEEGDDKKGLSKKQQRILYEKSIVSALKKLSDERDTYLTPEALQTYSPKFLSILENIKNPSHIGLHLIYSQFRTLEGIGILKLVLETNGFVQFKIIKEGNTWKLVTPETDLHKPSFVLYTGTETSEEKEIIRNVFNGNWKFVPEQIKTKIQKRANNNMYGDIIKVFMITASGAEGISLENVRYVHITEPYWHPVRIEQVIGRARRICSHQYLPEELRTVQVFLYLMVLSDTQKKSDISIALRMNDLSKLDNKTPVTTDESLYEIATIKENISEKLLEAVKESAIDCALHTNKKSKEQLKCFTFGYSDPTKFSYKPNINEEDSDEISDKNKKSISWKGFDVTINKVNYVRNNITNEIFDYDSYYRGTPIKIGDLVLNTDGTYKLNKI